MRSLKDVEKEISETKEELKNVKGSECEVYSRITGYYRATRNWNKGKAEEYKKRKMYEIAQSDFSCGCTAKRVK